jgi:CheY-like chemotaxis protein
VADSGPGILPEELEKIFEPFSQTSSGKKAGTGRQTYHGSGLGLSISREYVRLMGGEIAVESVPGRGSIFLFTLPVATAHVAEDVICEPTSRLVGLAPGQPQRAILVVDDVLETRKLLASMLQTLGLTTYEASDGLEAIDAWRNWRPDLVLMDLRMPNLDGYEATRLIKADPQGASAIIIALTASAFEDERMAILSAGCADFLCKPARIEDIVRLLEKHLGAVFIRSSDGPVAERYALEQSSVSQAWETIPREWIEILHQAIMAADFDGITEVIGQIRGPAPQLAESLEGRANNFDLRGLMGLLPPVSPTSKQNALSGQSMLQESG